MASNPKLLQHGTVTIAPTGQVKIADFRFETSGSSPGGEWVLDLAGCGRSAAEWAIKCLREAVDNIGNPSMLVYAEGLSPEARATYLQELREMSSGPPHCGEP